MSAINALLPIVSTANSQKDGSQNRADDARAATSKSATSAESKALSQDAASEKRMEEKRFINVYEEGIQEQGRQQERAAAKAAASLRQQQDAAAIAASGTSLPLEGESLPTASLPKTGDDSGLSAQVDSNEAPITQGPSAPTAPVGENSEEAKQPRSNVIGTIELTSFEQQQKAAADAFHALVSAQNGKLDNKTLTRSGVQQMALSKSEQLNSSPTLVQSHEGTQTLNPVLGVDLDLATAAIPADAANEASIGESRTSEVRESANDVLAKTLAQEDAQLVAMSQTNQRNQLAEATTDGNQAMQRSAEPDQAERVRAWRGVDGQEMRSATTAAANQAAKQDPLVSAVPLSHSGQIQQFAQSLRLSSGQTDSANSAALTDRTGTSLSQTSGDATPWRADTSNLSANSSNGRTAAVNTPFAQTMQASNFGQPLGEAVGQNAWGESIAQRVSMMAGLKVSSAQIQLDPPELGAMTVKVSVQGDKASVSFHSPHALVRDALELSFPRLQEMMGQQGLQLLDAQVSDNAFAGQGSSESGGGNSRQSSGELADETTGPITSQIVQVATGLIDFYA